MKFLKKLGSLFAKNKERNVEWIVREGKFGETASRDVRMYDHEKNLPPTPAPEVIPASITERWLEGGNDDRPVDDSRVLGRIFDTEQAAVTFQLHVATNNKNVRGTWIERKPHLGYVVYMSIPWDDDEAN